MTTMNRTFKRILLVAASTSLLSACGAMRAVPYECPLDGDPANGARCASVQETYQAARADRGIGQVSVFDRRTGNVEEAAPAPYVGAVPSAIPGAQQQGMPVFVQPKVFRVWVRPYKDTNGNLHAGEAVYFSTQGTWNYGTLAAPGQAGASMAGPSRPGAHLGFNPVTSQPPPAAGTRGTPPAPADASRPAVPGDITQPYQRLTQ